MRGTNVRWRRALHSVYGTEVNVQRPSIKRVVLALLLFASPFLLIGVACGVNFLRIVPETFVEPVFDDMRDDITRFGPNVIADAREAAKADLGVTKIPGRDAGQYLNALLPWIRGDEILPGSLPDPATARADELDYSWMARLHEFDTWDIEANHPSIDADAPAMQRAFPSGKALSTWARRRLEAGERAGELEAARRDVAQLGRLATQTESVWMAKVGLRLMRLAHPERDVELRRVERVAVAQSIWAIAPVTDAHMQDFALRPTLRPFQCAGLNEALGWNLAVRGLIGPDYPEEYAASGRLLDASAGVCRLSILRRTWHGANGAGELPNGPRAFCAHEQSRTGWCWLPDVVFWIPQVRRAGGGVLAALALPAYLGGYRSPPGSPE